MSVKEALEKTYACLHDNNTGIDAAIAELKAAMVAAGEKSVTMTRVRLPQNNRQGRKILQTYFKKRGVTVVYDEPPGGEPQA